MNAQRLARLAATTLSLGALVIGLGAAKAPGTAKVEQYLVKGDTATAVAAAEANVMAMPASSVARAQLGRAYLAAGRFNSAEAAFTDALSIDPTDGASALKLALVKIALGKNDAARAVLETNRDRLGGADYGLAIALSGDANGAVQILEAVTRAPGADAKARQNLALAYALQGKWLNARVMAVQDLSPTDADARIVQWMNFVRPATSHDQVASLLGVNPVADTGQPTALALVKPAGAPVAVAVAEPVAAPEPVPAPVAVAVAAVEPTPAPLLPSAVMPVAAPVAETPHLVFASAREVTQPLPAFKPAPLLVAKPYRPVVTAAVRSSAPGRYVVQLGAFGSDAMAAKAWHKRSAHWGLASYTPSSANFRLGNANFIRLSVGGFAQRGQATSLCTKVRVAGGQCFVRSTAGDRMAAWFRPGQQERLASR